MTRHERAMLAIARAYFACEADALDAVQDAFVKAYRALAGLQSEGRFAAWLARITTNTCLDILRARTDKVSLAEFSSTMHLQQRFGQEDLTPASLSSRKEEAQFVRAAVGRLREKARVILLLRYADGMSYERIGEYLDLPVSTVRGRLHAAKQALRRILETDGEA